MSVAPQQHRYGITRRQIVGLARHLVLISICLVVICPIAYMFIASFKSIQDFFEFPYGLPAKWEWRNYVRAWEEANVAVTFTNSVIVAGLGVLFSTVLATLASYGLGQPGRGRPLSSAMFMLFVGGLLVPVQLIVLPLFILVRQLGLYGTLFSIIMPYSALGLPLAVLILVPFFSALPGELRDAALIDGANEWQVFWRIMLPLVRPALASVVILNGVWMWNDFFIPLIIATKPATHTMSVGIMSFFGVYSTEWGLVFASVAISTLPLILAYVLLTRQFVAGLSAGALKG
ncbi:carbohydrate ABC transporter permease [Chloroflexota bacterium]